MAGHRRGQSLGRSLTRIPLSAVDSDRCRACGSSVWRSAPHRILRMTTRSLVGSVDLRSSATCAAVTGDGLVAPAAADEGHDVGDLLIGQLQPELRHAIGVGRAFDDQRRRAVEHEIDRATTDRRRARSDCRRAAADRARSPWRRARGRRRTAPHRSRRRAPWHDRRAAPRWSRRHRHKPADRRLPAAISDRPPSR